MLTILDFSRFLVISTFSCVTLCVGFCICKCIQEAQLPLRNRASTMHFFVAKLLSVAVMTYTYVYHLRNLRPMTG